jgi:DNA repair exonuclease SbcCD ATPase subunit
MDGVDGRIVVLRENIGVKADIEGKSFEETCTLTAHERMRQETADMLREKRAEVDRLKEIIQQNALAIQKRADLQGQIDRLTEEMGKEKAAAEQDIKVLSNKWNATKELIRDADTILKDWEIIETASMQADSLQSQIADLQIALDELNQELPGHQDKANAKQAEIVGLRQRAKDLDNDPALAAIKERLAAAVAALGSIDKDLASLAADPDLSRLKAELSGLERAAKVGEGIKADCRESSCGAIAAVLDAKEKLPDASAAVQYREEELFEKRSLMEKQRLDIMAAIDIGQVSQSSRLSTIGDTKTLIADHIATANHDLRNLQQVVTSTTEILTLKRQDIARKRAELEKQKVLAAKLPEIRIAEQRKADLEKQLAEVTEQGTAKKTAWTEKEASTNQLISIIYDDQLKIVIDHLADESLVMIQKEIAEIETVKIPALDTQIQAARDQITTLQAELRKIEEAEAELETVRAERDTLALKIARWRYLQIGCGEKGLQAIEISGAAPMIVQYANDLLMSAFDIPYTMRLKTFDEETQAECFKILIICPDGQEIDLDLISGGQRAWCVQALWLAMSLLKQHSSGAEFDCFCADESDGALDQENAARYAALYPAFTKIAKLKELYFISHQPPARALADHVLQFTPGKNPEWK